LSGLTKLKETLFINNEREQRPLFWDTLSCPVPEAGCSYYAHSKGFNLFYQWRFKTFESTRLLGFENAEPGNLYAQHLQVSFFFGKLAYETVKLSNCLLSSLNF